MSDRIYKTANGRTIDIGALIMQNEHVRAVGNMKVNARGEKIDDLKTPSQSKKAASRALKIARPHRAVKLSEPEIPGSPVVRELQKLEEEKAKVAVVEAASAATLLLANHVAPVVAEDIPDLTTISINEQIDALAEQMLADISVSEESVLVEYEETTETDFEALTGLAKAIALAKKKS